MGENNTSTQSNSKALSIFVLLFIASLALSAFLFYKYKKNTAEILDQKEVLNLAYHVLELKEDSLENRLEFVQNELQYKIDELLTQTSLSKELRAQLIQKKRELAAAHLRIKRLINGQDTSVSSSGGPRNLLEAKNEIKNLKKINDNYLVKVEQAQKEYERTQALAATNKRLAKMKSRENDSLALLNMVLEEKLSTASILRIAALSSRAIRERNGEQEVVTKAKKVNRIKISFKVLGSQLTITEDKELTIRILAPNGAVLTESVSKLTDSDDLYSLKKIIGYDGSEKGVTYYYDQKAEYMKGNYTVELIHNNILLDKSTFSLR